jgi:hypothetical protein
VRRPPAWELVGWSSEFVLRQLLTSTDVNMEVKEAMALEAVTRWQLVKIQQTEKILYVL